MKHEIASGCFNVFYEISAIQIIWKLYVMETSNPTAGVGIVAIDCN
jgi:hypothetical protein